MARQRRYWDSCCFLGYFREEPDKVDACRSVINAAEKGEVVIVTSSLTIAEVVKVKREEPLPIDLHDLVVDFFKRDYIVVRQLDRFMAERARELWWSHQIEPKDAIHVVTAMANNVHQLDTFDLGLLKQHGKVGDPPLSIGKPFMVTQLALPVATADDDGLDEEELEQIGLDLDADPPREA